MNIPPHAEPQIPPLVKVYQAKDTTPHWASALILEKMCWRLRYKALTEVLLNRFDGCKYVVAFTESIVEQEAGAIEVTVTVFISEALHAAPETK